MRVVLYAEGPGELVGESGLSPPTPGEKISDDGLGAGHVLIQRSIAKVSQIPELAVAFEGPLRHRARVLKGSDFLMRERLRQALRWPTSSGRPELVIVLVDSDGDSPRQAALEQSVSDIPVPHVIAVAVQEFEAWLIADIGAVNRAVGGIAATTPEPESLKPSEAKAALSAAFGKHPSELPIGVRRRTVAAEADLEVVARRCPAFNGFLGRLQRVLTRPS